VSTRTTTRIRRSVSGIITAIGARASPMPTSATNCIPIAIGLRRISHETPFWKPAAKR
jgi:hypothetical protein